MIRRAQVNLGGWSSISHSYETGSFLLTAANTRIAGLGFQAFPTSASHCLMEPGVQTFTSGFYICTRDLTSTPRLAQCVPYPLSHLTSPSVGFLMVENRLLNVSESRRALLSNILTTPIRACSAPYPPVSQLKNVAGH